MALRLGNRVGCAAFFVLFLFMTFATCLQMSEHRNVARTGAILSDLWALRRAGIPWKPSSLVDAWNQPLVYRCPGVVHEHGWDLWSVGPNGVDEQGQGDDILVGEDVAEVASGR